jgi:hypothetical protein
MSQEPTPQFQILGQEPLEFLGTLLLAINLFFACLFIALFLFYMIFEPQPILS